MQQTPGRNYPRRGLPPVSQHHQPGHQPPRPPPEDPNRRIQLRQLSQVPTDREIPDGVEDMVIGDVVQRYRAMREVERKLDAVMINKRLAAKDSGQRYERKLRTMRVWVSAQSTEDPSARRIEESFDFNDDNGSGKYRMRIEGRLLDEEDDDSEDEDEQPQPEDSMELDNPGKAKKPQRPKQETQKFTSFFKHVSVDFHPPKHALPGASVPPSVEWKKPEQTGSRAPPEENYDCIEFERKLEEGVANVTITLTRAEPHGRVRGKLSDALARVLDREYEDQSGAMMGLYNYVRLMGLEQEGQPQNFRCDDALKDIFGSESSSFIYAPEKIAENIQPLPPVTLPFTIRLSSTPAEPTIYDIPVLVDDPLDSFASYFRSVSNPNHPASHQRLQEIHTLDKDIALAVQGMYASKGKITFMNQLSAEPVSFIRKWISSQQADQEVILAEERSRGPEWHRSGKDGLWGSTAARESVGLLLARQRPV